jgi:glucosamine kinase
MNAGAPLIIAVDGGGTGCRARIEDCAGRVLGAASGGPANLTTDPDGALAAISAVVRAAYEAANLPVARAASDVACYALAGTEGGVDEAALNAAPGFARLRIVSDLDATVEGALGREDGLVAGLGTGSFFVVQRGGARQRAGGWGFALSDECSGAMLGRATLRRAVAARDGLDTGSDFTDAVLAGFDDMRAMIAFAKAATPQDYARYARDLVAAAEAGDPVAGEIFGAAVAQLCAILDRLGVQDLGALCLVGGLGPVYRRHLPAALTALCVDPKGTTLDGAAALARRAL